jgi:hypothetical protein
MSKKIDWNKTVNEYLKFNGSAREFCNTRNITKGQLFYYKKKFLEVGTTFCPINIDTSEMESIENINLSNNSETVINIEIGNAKISVPTSETALITSIIKELTSIC